MNCVASVATTRAPGRSVEDLGPQVIGHGGDQDRRPAVVAGRRSAPPHRRGRSIAIRLLLGGEHQRTRPPPPGPRPPRPPRRPLPCAAGGGPGSAPRGGARPGAEPTAVRAGPRWRARAHRRPAAPTLPRGWRRTPTRRRCCRSGCRAPRGTGARGPPTTPANPQVTSRRDTGASGDDRRGRPGWGSGPRSGRDERGGRGGRHPDGDHREQLDERARRSPSRRWSRSRSTGPLRTPPGRRPRGAARPTAPTSPGDGALQHERRSHRAGRRAAGRQLPERDELTASTDRERGRDHDRHDREHHRAEDQAPAHRRRPRRPRYRRSERSSSRTGSAPCVAASRAPPARSAVEVVGEVDERRVGRVAR